MSITYVLSSNRGKVRFYLGDTQDGSGPRPDGRNFSDSEIEFLLTTAGSVVQAVALGFEVLASEWTSYGLSEREGEVQFDAKGLAATYDAKAKEWRGKTDETSAAGSLSAGVIALDFMQKGD